MDPLECFFNHLHHVHFGRHQAEFQIMTGVVASEIRHMSRHSGAFSRGIFLGGQRFIRMKADLRHELAACFHQQIVIKLFLGFGQFIFCQSSDFFFFTHSKVSLLVRHVSVLVAS